MRLKLLIFSLLALVSLPVAAQEAETEETAYEAFVRRRHERWMKLTPSLASLQYAGDIGMISAGFGWDYGRHDRWETTIHAGFLPKFHSDRADVTFTLRQNFIPWSIGLGSRRWADDAKTDMNGERLQWNRRAFASFEPIYFTVFLNTIFDDEFWVHEPEKYNGGDYYRFSSKVRLHLGLGTRFSVNIPHAQRKHFDKVSYYAVLSSYDLAIISAIPNEKLTMRDIMCLGVGVQYKFF